LLRQEVHVSTTVLQHLPSLRALRASDERLLEDELRLVATKQQIAVVRTLADELERCLVHGGAATALQEQLVQELARLGCRSIETAAAMAEKPADLAEQSGIHCVLAVVDS
jgi:2-keto-3-deoxy-6-phosphogluconate aldolase